MAVKQKELRYIARHLAKAKAGSLTAISNVAATYRILHRHAAAFRWWRKGADLGSGSDLLEVGYCQQHGAGTQRDTASAIRSYGSAMASSTLSQLEREEAMYCLAIALLSGIESKEIRVPVVELLQRANADNDYPQAACLLNSLDRIPEKICTCRRGLRFTLARLHCPIHRPMGPQTRRSSLV